MDLQNASEYVVGLAQSFIEMMQRVDPEWTRAYWRFDCDDSKYGSNASYESPEDVLLVDSFKERPSFKALNELGRKLWALEPDPDKRFCVCLLLVDSNFKYEVKFERQDASKWRITKLNGGTGLPAGL